MLEYLKLIYEKYKDSNLIRFSNYLLLFVSFYYLWNKLKKLEYESLFNLDIGIILMSILLIYLSFYSQSVAWAKLFDTEQKNYLIKVWLGSNLAKYIPFKVGVILKRVNEIRLKSDISLKIITKNYLLEQVMLLSSAFVISICYFFQDLRTFTIVYLLIILALRTYGLRKKIESNLITAFVYYFLSQYCYLISVYLISIEIFGQFEIKYASIYIISTIVGMFVFTAPVGLGVRESVFIFLLGNINNLNEVFNFIVIARILVTIVDILSFLSSYLYLKEK